MKRIEDLKYYISIQSKELSDFKVDIRTNQLLTLFKKLSQNILNQRNETELFFIEALSQIKAEKDIMLEKIEKQNNITSTGQFSEVSYFFLYSLCSHKITLVTTFRFSAI